MSMIGVAISTTGDLHRLDLLRNCVEMWDAALPMNSSLFVTVDGDDEAVARVARVVADWTGSVFRVGQPLPVVLGQHVHTARDSRLGVAVNKNTGLELLMGYTGLRQVEHLFLSDDDTWPLSGEALALHVSGNSPLPLDLKHSMVCWGKHRLGWTQDGYAEWTWPRGAMIYTHRSVVEKVGGMIEAFGPGGHEHVEWSRRIHQARLTPAQFPSPLAYAYENAMAAQNYWHAEDMPRSHEGLAAYAERKRGLTSVRRTDADWPMIDEIMRCRDGNTSSVPYTAGENHRGSATLYHNPSA